MRDKPRQPRRGHDHKENRCLGRSGHGTHPEEVVPEDSSCYSGSQAGNERAFRQQWLEAAPSVNVNVNVNNLCSLVAAWTGSRWSGSNTRRTEQRRGLGRGYMLA